MNSKIITVVKRTTSALIIALSLGAICIPAVAVKIAHKPDTALCSYYRAVPFGGNNYSSINKAKSTVRVFYMKDHQMIFPIILVMK